jgi:hypothetical protein
MKEEWSDWGGRHRRVRAGLALAAMVAANERATSEFQLRRRAGSDSKFDWADHGFEFPAMFVGPFLLLLRAAYFAKHSCGERPLSTMNSKFRSATAVALLCASLILVTDVGSETPDTGGRSILSPDKQWEYRCNDGLWSSIKKAGTNTMVLDLSNEVEVPYCEDAKVVWAPDSKRFAFNYTPAQPSPKNYKTTIFYQLRADEWVTLPSPVDDSAVDSFAQLAKHLPKGVRKPRLWNSDLARIVFKVRNWTDANTAVLYVYCASDKPRSRSSVAAFLFTLKFEAEGKWNIVKTQQLSAEEGAKEDMEDSSG